MRPATIWGSSASSWQRLALGDALGAEGHVDVETESGDQPLDDRGHARVHRAAQHEELPVGQAVGDLLDRGVHRAEVGVEVLVDRRADHHHDVLGAPDGLPVERGLQPAGGERRPQRLGGAGLDERHFARVHGVDGVGPHVVERDLEAAAGERQPERQADAATSAHDRDVVRLHHGFTRLVSGTARS